jgi:hypothetical protein
MRRGQLALRCVGCAWAITINGSFMGSSITSPPFAFKAGEDGRRRPRRLSPLGGAFAEPKQVPRKSEVWRSRPRHNGDPAMQSTEQMTPALSYAKAVEVSKRIR